MRVTTILYRRLKRKGDISVRALRAIPLYRIKWWLLRLSVGMGIKNDFTKRMLNDADVLAVIEETCEG
jgi:hypothetical protein